MSLRPVKEILSTKATLETGGVLVGEEVTITLDVQFVKA